MSGSSRGLSFTPVTVVTQFGLGHKRDECCDGLGRGPAGGLEVRAGVPLATSLQLSGQDPTRGKTAHRQVARGAWGQGPNPLGALHSRVLRAARETVVWT